VAEVTISNSNERSFLEQIAIAEKAHTFYEVALLVGFGLHFYRDMFLVENDQ